MNWYQFWDWFDIAWFNTKDKAFDWFMEKVFWHLRENTFTIMGFIFLIVFFIVLLHRVEKKIFEKMENFWKNEEHFIDDIMKQYANAKNNPDNNNPRIDSGGNPTKSDN